MNERLPSVVMRQVDARLARVERLAPRAVARPYRKAGTPSPKPSAPPAASATAPAPQPAASPAVVHQVEAKRPAGDPVGHTGLSPTFTSAHHTHPDRACSDLLSYLKKSRAHV